MTTDWFSGFKLLQLETQNAKAAVRVGGRRDAPTLVPTYEAARKAGNAPKCG